MSFLFTYANAQSPGATPSYDALTLLERAKHLTTYSTSFSLRARLAAIKAEIHVNLNHFDKCMQELEIAEELISRGEDQSNNVPDTITSFDRAAFTGYNGTCLLRMGKPLDALVTLEEGHRLQGGSESIHDTVLLTDMAAAQIKLGMYTKACELIQEALPVIVQIKSKNHFLRVCQLQHDLQSWKHTVEVKDVFRLIEVSQQLIESM